MLSTNCFQAKAGQLNRQWYVIDAQDQVVGRLAAQIAPILMGKHRPTYTPHIDTGDYVIVINVEKVVLTGDKWNQKVYQRYSGYPGGQKEEVAWKLHKRHPDRILYEAIRRMMPKNKIGRHMLSKLKLVVGSTHPHQAQQPVPLEPVHGRIAAAGIQFAPKPSPPRPKRKTERAPRDVETEATEAASTAAEALAYGEPAVTSPPADSSTAETAPVTEAAPQAETQASPPETAPAAPPAEAPEAQAPAADTSPADEPPRTA